MKPLLLLLFIAAACKGSSDEGMPASSTKGAPPPGESPTNTQAPVTAKDVFAQRCVPCHGSTGNGDGPASATLDPKPRKYIDTAWQASVTDEYIVKIIKYGGAAVGKSPAMPNNPDLDETVVVGLKDIVRAFAKK